MRIEVLGSGCARCAMLEKAVREAVAEAGIEATVVKVDDMEKILDYGVMMTPGLVVDGVVKSTGRLLKPAEIIALLS